MAALIESSYDSPLKRLVGETARYYEHGRAFDKDAVGATVDTVKNTIGATSHVIFKSLDELFASVAGAVDGRKEFKALPEGMFPRTRNDLAALGDDLIHFRPLSSLNDAVNVVFDPIPDGVDLLIGEHRRAEDHYNLAA